MFLLWCQSTSKSCVNFLRIASNANGAHLGCRACVISQLYQNKLFGEFKTGKNLTENQSHFFSMVIGAHT